MIVVVGRVKTDAEKRAALIQIAQKVATASRAEAGCISYRICQDTESAEDFVFVEEWESEEALQTHFRTPHIAEFHGLDHLGGRRGTRREVPHDRELARPV